MTGPAPAAPPCPSCQSPASGKYCSNCGAPLAGARCAACDTALTPGAKFCHRCGTPAGMTADARLATRGAQRGFGSVLPWAVAAIALVALIALVASQHFTRSNPSAKLASEVPATATQSGTAQANISQNLPEERSERPN